MRSWTTSLAILAVYLGIATSASLWEKNDVCTTQECYDTASRIKNSMKPEVNPCDDFYEYTCGNYEKSTPIPENKNIVSGFDVLEDQYNLDMKSLFKADIEKDEMRVFKLPKILYKSCMNKDAIEAAGLRPFNDYLKALGGWPVLEGDSWNESNFDWMASVAEWYRSGYYPNCFIRITATFDPTNSSRSILSVNAPYWQELTDFQKGFDESDVTKAHYKTMVDTAVLFGVKRKIAEDELKEALLFKIELSKLIPKGKPEDNRITVKELIERYPKIDWRDTFVRMYHPTLTISDDDIVLVKVPKYINPAIDLVLKTSPRVLANYALFEMLFPRMLTGNRAMEDIISALVSVVSGKIEPSPRWVDCVRLIKNAIPLSVIAMYAKKYYKTQSGKELEDIFREVRREFRTNIYTVPFLDKVTRKVAIRKVDAIKDVIGFPDGIFNNSYLNDYYQDLTLFERYYFLNDLHLLQFQYKETVQNFRKPINKINSRRILALLAAVNANAEVDLNSIFFSTSVLRGSIFHPERPRYINFGTVGTIYAHELTHFFDNAGSLIDEHGNKKNWWTPSTKEAFEEGVQCFVDQYGNYTHDTLNLKVDGKQTSGENIADNGSMKIAYRAYIKSMHGKTPEKKLPGLDYTPTQMYWIALGNQWCVNYRPQYLKFVWQWSAHTLERFRVFGMVSNSEEFAKDFNCTLGSKMNPVKKCSIW